MRFAFGDPRIHGWMSSPATNNHSTPRHRASQMATLRRSLGCGALPVTGKCIVQSRVAYGWQYWPNRRMSYQSRTADWHYIVSRYKLPQHSDP